MNERRYIVDIMRTVVAAVEARLLPQLQAYDSNIQAVHYEYGHPIEILETLRQMDESSTLRYKKYPLVALFTDIKEQKGVLGEYSHATLQLVVVHHTKPEYKAEERRIKNFIPVIHPIVDELFNQVVKSKYFLDSSTNTLERTEIDRYYWGRQAAGGNDANKGNDYLDATEIELNVRVNPNCLGPFKMFQHIN